MAPHGMGGPSQISGRQPLTSGTDSKFSWLWSLLRADCWAVYRVRLRGVRSVGQKCGHGGRKHVDMRRKNGLYQRIFRDEREPPVRIELFSRPR